MSKIGSGWGQIGEWFGDICVRLPIIAPAPRAGQAEASPSLICRCVYDQAVECFGHFDLAGEPRGRLNLEGCVDLFFFFG